jgi:hypothetical protein
MPQFEMSGVISGCEKRSVHDKGLVVNTVKISRWASATVETEWPSIKISHAPRSWVRHLSMRAPGVPGSIDTRTSRPCFVMKRRPPVRWWERSHLRRSREVSKARLYGSGDMLITSISWGPIRYSVTTSDGICLWLGLGPGSGDCTRVALAATEGGVAVTLSGSGSRRHWGGAYHFGLQQESEIGGQATSIGVSG